MLMLKGMHVQFPYFSRAASTNFYSYAVLLRLISFQLWEFIKTSVCFSLSLPFASSSACVCVCILAGVVFWCLNFSQTTMNSERNENSKEKRSKTQKWSEKQHQQQYKNNRTLFKIHVGRDVVLIRVCSTYCIGILWPVRCMLRVL